MKDEEIYELVRAAANQENRFEQAAEACERCSNNPKNGGSGVCWCILGMQTIC